MTDRKLLEAAAKAAGYEIDRWAQDESGIDYAWLTNADPWQPLLRNTMTDCMGDALRLAVKLKLNIAQGAFSVGVNDAAEVDEAALVRGEHERCEVLRRAIVRAAAAIGGAK